MHGIFTIFRKEMEDHFSSIRFLLISAFIVMVGVIIASMVGMGIQEESKGMAKPTFLFLWLFTSTGKLFSFVQFIGFFGPLIGIFLGFDSINRERVSRTLSKLLSQPIYRDSVINAKFLAGVTILAIVLVAIVLIISGLGIRLIGVVPGAEEVLRLVIYLIASIIYIGFWLGISRDGKAAGFVCKNGPCFSDRPSMSDLFDPEFNVSYATRMLAELIGNHGEVRDALRAYGPMDVGYSYAALVIGIMNRYQ